MRLVHTHLKNEPLTQDDLTDLALLRLDSIVAIGVKDMLPDNIYVAHLMPHGSEKSIEVLPPVNFHSFNLDFISFMESLEEEMDRKRMFDQRDLRERAILISVSKKPKHEQEDSLEELKELAFSSDVLVLDAVIQRP
ncbi:MAG: GTPase HflX, partial [Nitrospirae bacterium]|nr:GTPase HflX [Nitrospirota bacterium]